MPKFIAILSPTLAILLLGSQNCYAQSSGSLNSLSDIYACADISEAMERLACYDTTAGRLEVAEKSGEIMTITRSDLDQVKKDSFGLKEDTKTTLELLTQGDTSKISTAPTEPKVKARKVKERKVKKSEKRASLKIDDLNEVKIEIKRTKIFGYEKTRFYLANGQVWDQIDNHRIRVPKEKDGNPNNAVIRKAALGSFLLRINGKGRAIRIKRTK